MTKYKIKWQNGEMKTATFESHLATIEKQGYCIIENAIEPELLLEMTETVKS